MEWKELELPSSHSHTKITAIYRATIKVNNVTLTKNVSHTNRYQKRATVRQVAVQRYSIVKSHTSRKGDP